MTELKKRLIWKIGILAAIPLVVLAVLTVKRVIVWNAISHQNREMRGRGLPASPSEIDRWRGGDDKTAAIYAAAFRQMRQPELERENLLVAGAARFAPPNEKLSAAVRRTSLIYLKANSAAMALLRQAGTARSCKFPIDFTRGKTINLAHIAPLRQAARLFAIEALLHIDTGSPDDAAKAIAVIWNIARALDNEPLLLSLKSRDEIAEIGLQCLELCLERSPPSENASRELAAELAELESSRPLRQAIIGQTCMLPLFIHLYERQLAKLDDHRLKLEYGLHKHGGTLDENRLTAVAAATELATSVDDPQAPRAFSERINQLPGSCPIRLKLREYPERIDKHRQFIGHVRRVKNKLTAKQNNPRI